ncbi:hypothetical protein [Herbidospora cretacea]|uniref:AraC-like ligand-binding domain-containing protein n=1 Tax=Herbidospora cretacea TaxID=28444 RepID=UPI003AFA5295
MRNMTAPMQIRCEDPHLFRGHIARMDLGDVQISSITSAPCDSRRTREMVRQDDPELFQLAFNQYGHTTISQDRRSAQSGPMDLVLFHTSRPSETRTFAASNRGILVVFPGNLLPLAPRKLERLTATTARPAPRSPSPPRPGRAAARLPAHHHRRRRAPRGARPRPLAKAFRTGQAHVVVNSSPAGAGYAINYRGPAIKWLSNAAARYQVALRRQQVSGAAVLDSGTPR